MQSRVLAFPQAEYERRFELIRSLAAEQGIDYLVISEPAHTCWLSGFNPTGLFYKNQLQVDVRRGDATVFTHRIEESLGRSQSWVEDFLIWRHGDDPLAVAAERLRRVLGEVEGRTIGVSLGSNYLPAADFLKLQDLLPGALFVDVTTMIDDARLSKSDLELEELRRSAGFATQAWNAAIDAVRPGVTETEILAAIESASAKAGSEYSAAVTLVSSGPRTASVHSLPSDRSLKAGDEVLIEVWGVSKRYHTNLVRTVFVTGASDDAQRAYDVARRSYQAGLAAIAVGKPIGDIDRATKQVRQDYADFIPARSGFGLELGYPPTCIGSLSILETDPHIVSPGLAFSLEPSIAGYKDRTYIVGNDIVVTDAGPEELFAVPPDLLELR